GSSLKRGNGRRFVAGLPKRQPALKLESRTGGMPVRQQAGCTPHEIRGRGHVATLVSASTGGSESLGAADAERYAVHVKRTELGQIAVSLLEVVTENFLELGRAIRGSIGVIRPGDVALMQTCPLALQDSGIRRVTDHG